MSDEEAFFELVKANAQGELYPLEIGIHALKYVELSAGGRGKKGGLSEYAREINKGQSTVSELKNSALVYKGIAQAIGLSSNLLEKAKHLSHISKTPESYWQQLTELLIIMQSLCYQYYLTAFSYHFTVILLSICYHNDMTAFR